jgi:plasmid stabilization system protein ParE
MPRPVIEVHPEATDEARAARKRYEAQSSRAGERFLAELSRAMDLISDAPDQWPKYLHGTRQYKLRRFPYLVVYRALNDTIQVVAVAHTGRKPGYWKGRTRG